jgi:hypothetical protein
MFKGQQVQSKRYRVVARRKADEPWTEWNTTDSFDNVLEQIKVIESYGWLAKVNEIKGGAVYVTKPNICN